MSFSVWDTKPPFDFKPGDHEQAYQVGSKWVVTDDPLRATQAEIDALTAQQTAAAQTQAADAADFAAVKADAQIVAFFNKTPAQIDAYVATIANLADAKVALAILAKAVLVLARKSLKNGGG